MRERASAIGAELAADALAGVAPGWLRGHTGGTLHLAPFACESRAGSGIDLGNRGVHRVDPCLVHDAGAGIEAQGRKRHDVQSASVKHVRFPSATLCTEASACALAAPHETVLLDPPHAWTN